MSKFSSTFRISKHFFSLNGPELSNKMRFSKLNSSLHSSSFRARAFFFLLGFFVTLHLSVEPLELMMSLDPPKSLQVSVPASYSEDAPRLVFVTALERSWVREALLTRTAQALFPLKNKVIWVIVIPPEEDFREDLLVRRLQRYGVPWVILKAKLAGDRNARIIATAWALQEIPERNGIILYARMKDTYDSRLLLQVVSSTTRISVWPVGLLNPFSSPIVDNKGVILGHSLPPSSPDSTQPPSVVKGDVLIETGSFAVHLNYIKRIEEWMQWIDIPTWLVSDLKVELKNVKVIKPTFIGVWKSKFWEMPYTYPTDKKIETFHPKIQELLSTVIR